jgi:hypothetical protein
MLEAEILDEQEEFEEEDSAEPIHQAPRDDSPAPVKRYWALRIISTVFRISGGLCFLLAAIWLVILVYSFLTQPLVFAALFMALAPAGGLLLAGLYSFAMAEIITVFLDIEENTRRANGLLRRLWKGRGN